jgi:hypothetical protein
VAHAAGHINQAGCRFLVRHQQNDRKTDLLRDDPHRFHQIGVIGKDGGFIESLQKGIADEVNTDVHVRSFFFGIPDIGNMGSRTRR